MSYPRPKRRPIRPATIEPGPPPLPRATIDAIAGNRTHTQFRPIRAVHPNHSGNFGDRGAKAGCRNKINFILTRNEPWHAGQVSRRRRVTFGSGEQALSGFVAAPEDVILGKLWYYSEGGGDRHLRDIAGILRVTGDGIDRAEVERWAGQLGYLDIWQAIIEKVDGPDLTQGPGVP